MLPPKKTTNARPTALSASTEGKSAAENLVAFRLAPRFSRLASSKVSTLAFSRLRL